MGRPQLEPRTIDTGRLRIGGSAVSRGAVIRGATAVPLKLRASRFEGDTRGAYGSLVVVPDPTGSAAFLVTFEHRAAATPGVDAATLVVEFENADPARVEASLRGETVAACADGSLECGDECIAVKTDVRHCGRCDVACAAPLHAPAACRAGRCARGPCEAGFYDIDGDVTPGCEATCIGRRCTSDRGAVTELAAPPLPEWKLHLGAPVAGAAAGSLIQTSAGYTNFSTVGQTPSPAAGVGAMSGPSYRMIGGIHAVQADR